MKPLRLILPITLFILSGVLAWVGIYNWEIYTIRLSMSILLSQTILLFSISLTWALGGFDD